MMEAPKLTACDGGPIKSLKDKTLRGGHKFIPLCNQLKKELVGTGKKKGGGGFLTFMINIHLNELQATQN
jgi:hypothetical protein